MNKKKFIVYMMIAFMSGVILTSAFTLIIEKGVLGYAFISSDSYKVMNDMYTKYSKTEQIYNTIDKYFYKDFDKEKLLTESYKGMVEGLGDPYSSYMTAEEYESWKATATGEYSGVGVTFSQNDKKQYVVVQVQESSPAEKAGIKAGDIILRVDDKKYDDMEIMASAIRGREGTEVKILYSREGVEKTVKLKREKIVQNSISSSMLDKDIGYIQIGSFIESTSEEFDKALAEVEKKKAKSLILDLRNNGGGLVDECIAVADEFLDKGVVTYVEDRQGNKTEYKSEDGKTNLKTVVLVNENSASASEILAGALKDNDFDIVGKTTFGKGVIQSTAELDDGSALKITILQYFSPKGNAINNNGVKPTYKIENNEDKDLQLEKAMELLK